MYKTRYACKQIWRLLIPDSAVGAGRVFFDLFNATASDAGAGGRIVISEVKVMVAGDVDAIAGVLAANLHLHKTTAVGTTGTAATLQGASNTLATFSTVTPAPGGLPVGITARLTPGGGATLGAWLAQTSVFTEPTADGTYAEKWLHNTNQEAIVIGQGEGIKVIQGAVATLGSIGFSISFGLLEQ